MAKYLLFELVNCIMIEWSAMLYVLCFAGFRSGDLVCQYSFPVWLYYFGFSGAFTMNNSKIPLITVLVPIFNVQDYLEDCLESLRVQTLSDFEVICINDGSTDNSRVIIESFIQKDDRFCIIDKDNSGYGASMNLGLDKARGEFIAILESDDFCEPNTLEVLHNAIVYYGADVAKANCYLHWTAQPKKSPLLKLVPTNQSTCLTSPQESEDIFFMPPAIWAALYRRDFLQSNNICFLETPGASYQDTSFNFKVWACAERAVFLKDAFVHYRQDNQASSVKSDSKVYCVCDECDEVEQFLGLRQQTSTRLQALRAKLKFNTYLWNYERLDERFQLDFIERFASEMLAEEKHGYIDLQMFSARERSDYQQLMRSPASYHAMRLAAGKGKLGKIRHYLKLGGLSLLAKIVKSKLSSSKG